VAGTFRTGPRGRGRGFRFTSSGDHSIPAPAGRGLGPHTPNARYVVDAVNPWSGDWALPRRARLIP
jgi:hypothetical protein